MPASPPGTKETWLRCGWALVSAAAINPLSYAESFVNKGGVLPSGLNAARVTPNSDIQKRSGVVKSLTRAYAIIMLIMAGAAESAEQFDQTSCSAVKGAVELFLGIADENFKEAEIRRRNGDIVGADSKFEDASSMSELAENYSVVYATFCKP